MKALDFTLRPNPLVKHKSLEWKCKGVKGKNNRLEARKTFYGVQILITVHKHRQQNRVFTIANDDKVTISMNGTLMLSVADVQEITWVVEALTEIFAK